MYWENFKQKMGVLNGKNPGTTVPATTIPVPDPTREKCTRSVPDPYPRIENGEIRGDGDTRRPLVYRDLGQVLHSQLSVALRHETQIQYPCCVGSASE